MAELQTQLALRNLDVRGTKPILAARLRDAVESQGISVEEFVLSLQQRHQSVTGQQKSAFPARETNEETSQQTKSNSNVSTVSAVESIRIEYAKECARAAGLQAKAEFTRKKFELLQREMHMKLQLDFECEQLELQGEIAEANARKEVLVEKQKEMGLMAPVPEDSGKRLISLCSYEDPCTSGTGRQISANTSHACADDTDLNCNTIQVPTDVQNPEFIHGSQSKHRTTEPTAHNLHLSNPNDHEVS